MNQFIIIKIISGSVNGKWKENCGKMHTICSLQTHQ